MDVKDESYGNLCINYNMEEQLCKITKKIGKRGFKINFLSGKNKNCVNSLAMRRVLIIFASDFINVIH